MLVIKNYDYYNIKELFCLINDIGTNSQYNNIGHFLSWALFTLAIIVLSYIQKYKIQVPWVKYNQ